MGDKKYKYLFYILAAILVCTSFTWWSQYTFNQGQHAGIDSVKVMIQNEINNDSTNNTMEQEIKTKTNYHIRVKASGEETIAWRSTSGVWTNYEDPKITYNDSDITIGKCAE